jgi:cell division FtsZ-interacting protein ZapD
MNKPLRRDPLEALATAVSIDADYDKPRFLSTLTELLDIFGRVERLDVADFTSVIDQVWKLTQEFRVIVASTLVDKAVRHEAMRRLDQKTASLVEEALAAARARRS